MDTLGSLLPKRQASLLTKKVKRFTKEQLEEEINNIPRSDLSFKDMQGLKMLAVTRVNKGMSMYTWEKQNFRRGNPKQGASTCFCF